MNLYCNISNNVYNGNKYTPFINSIKTYYKTSNGSHILQTDFTTKNIYEPKTKIINPFHNATFCCFSV